MYVLEERLTGPRNGVVTGMCFRLEQERGRVSLFVLVCGTSGGSLLIQKKNTVVNFRFSKAYFGYSSVTTVPLLA